MKNNHCYFLLSILFLLLLHSCNSEKPRITAELKYSFPKEDSLQISVILQNKSNDSLFIIGRVSEIDFNEENSILENYSGSPEEQFKMLKEDAQDYINKNNEQSNLKDTIWLSLPKVKKRYQVNHKNEGVDVFDKLSNLEEAYYIFKRNSYVPPPPNGSDGTKIFYTDVDVYNLVISENINVDETYFFEEVVLLNPNERKTFFIDMSYLLLQKATYRLVFDFKTDDEIFFKEGVILENKGFKRFKGHILSNEIEIKSTTGVGLRSVPL